ncbi:hypothetical protein [Kitasatospora sp. NPDC088783]|uniref:hypothetical protein n=1 Tax=Kitasatospora sp. NPDC088783 TaxID=3364077 RepID=UPI0038175828
MNYYLTSPGLPVPADDEAGLHVGQYSRGWRFLFRAHPELGLTTLAAWLELVRRPGSVVWAESRYEVCREELEADMTAARDRHDRPLRDRWPVSPATLGYHQDGLHVFCARPFH